MLGAHVQNAPVGPPATSFVRSVVRTEALAIVAGYAGVEMLAELAQTSAALRVAMDRLAPEIFRAAAMAKFPVLRLQAPYLPGDTDWQSTYARHAKLADECDDRETTSREVVPTTTLDDYLLVAEVTRYAHPSGDALETVAYVLGEDDKYALFRLKADRPLALSVVADAILSSSGSTTDNHSKVPSILLTVLQKSTGKQAVLCHLGEILNKHVDAGLIFYKVHRLPLVYQRDIEAYLENLRHLNSDFIGAQAHLTFRHYDDTTNKPCGPAELCVEFRQCGDDGGCVFEMHEILVMLEHNIDFT
mmetsp:Transcript_6036/g.25263  ORF Transcript_6036/g.25263 Transcript_6036/m.25263 type:complete len:303 (+) Transcript_6036:365-1273(+)